MCIGSVQGACRFLKENKDQSAVCEALVSAFDSLYTSSVKCPAGVSSRNSGTWEVDAIVVLVANAYDEFNRLYHSSHNQWVLS